MIEPGNYGYGCDPQKTYEGDMKEAWLDHLMYDAPPEELADVFTSEMPEATALLMAHIYRNESLYGNPDIDGMIENAVRELDFVLNAYVEREWSEQREDAKLDAWLRQQECEE